MFSDPFKGRISFTILCKNIPNFLNEMSDAQTYSVSAKSKVFERCGNVHFSPKNGYSPQIFKAVEQSVKIVGLTQFFPHKLISVNLLK